MSYTSVVSSGPGYSAVDAVSQYREHLELPCSLLLAVVGGPQVAQQACTVFLFVAFLEERLHVHVRQVPPYVRLRFSSHSEALLLSRADPIDKSSVTYVDVKKTRKKFFKR